MLHINGAHSTVEITFIAECAQISFVIVRAVKIRPNRVVVEPLEHSIALVRIMILEVIVKDFMSSISHASCLWIAVTKISLQKNRGNGSS